MDTIGYTINITIFDTIQYIVLTLQKCYFTQYNFVTVCKIKLF